MTLHSTYRGELIWRVGLSWYTRSFGGDSFLMHEGEHVRHHRTLADAKAYITAKSGDEDENRSGAHEYEEDRLGRWGQGGR